MVRYSEIIYLFDFLKMKPGKSACSLLEHSCITIVMFLTQPTCSFVYSPVSFIDFYSNALNFRWCLSIILLKSGTKVFYG